MCLSRSLGGSRTSSAYQNSEAGKHYAFIEKGTTGIQWRTRGTFETNMCLIRASAVDAGNLYPVPAPLFAAVLVQAVMLLLLGFCWVAAWQHIRSKTLERCV